jgi:benzoyl-CoA-dihydrodiol lyase
MPISVDRSHLFEHREHWLVREIVHFIKRTLKRLDLTARSFFALIEPGSCWAGTLYELALAADRAHMLDDPDQPVAIACRDERIVDDEQRLTGSRPVSSATPLTSRSCSAGTVRSAGSSRCGSGLLRPRQLDWEDEIQLAIEARAFRLTR